MPGLLAFWAGAILLQTLGGDAAPIEPAKAKATAVIFISTVCPISNDYTDRFESLYRDYSARGVQFAFVYSNRNETKADLEKHVREGRFAFPVYRDLRNVLADRLEAEHTPTAVVLDGEGEVLYHGMIDDSVNPARVTARPFADALDAVLAGRPVPVNRTKAFGCTVKRVMKR